MWVDVMMSGLVPFLLNYPSDRWTLGRRWDDVVTRSNFKSETIFGFLSPSYLHGTTYLIFLVKPKNGIV